MVLGAITLRFVLDGYTPNNKHYTFVMGWIAYFLCSGNKKDVNIFPFKGLDRKQALKTGVIKPIGSEYCSSGWVKKDGSNIDTWNIISSMLTLSEDSRPTVEESLSLMGWSFDDVLTYYNVGTVESNRLKDVSGRKSNTNKKISIKKKKL
eukprot:GHVR01003195.1.p2 GENE.GHVR01003195.1~~GHVR01003195.1.p2  ORF type:complete len:150 (+),score=34.23 GHVR01003195.1:587-1036(+)